jgi:hypothetical protein
MKLNRFILNSDYGSLKNDTQSNTISATIPNGLTFNPDDPILAQETIDVGTINAGIRARGSSSKYSRVSVGPTIYSLLTCGIPSLGLTGIDLTLYCNIERISATTIRLTVAVEYSPGGPDYITEESQTINFVFSTFLSPFD